MPDDKPTTTALAFKIPAELGWRVLVVTNADGSDPNAPVELALREVRYWGFYRGTAAEPTGLTLLMRGVWGSTPSVEFQPLAIGGAEFKYVLETVSPLDARSDEVIVAECHARLQADPLMRASG